MIFMIDYNNKFFKQEPFNTFLRELDKLKKEYAGKVITISLDNFIEDMLCYRYDFKLQFRFYEYDDNNIWIVAQLQYSSSSDDFIEDGSKVYDFNKICSYFYLPKALEYEFKAVYNGDTVYECNALLKKENVEDVCLCIISFLYTFQSQILMQET